MIIVMQ